MYVFIELFGRAEDYADMVYDRLPRIEASAEHVWDEGEGNMRRAFLVYVHDCCLQERFIAEIHVDVSVGHGRGSNHAAMTVIGGVDAGQWFLLYSK